MEYPSFLMQTIFNFLNKFHYFNITFSFFFIIMENKSNENISVLIPLKTKCYFH